MASVSGGGFGSGSGPSASASNLHVTAVADAITNPKSTSSLLAEEYTMNPSTFLPSFLEMNLVDATNVSGRRTLHQVLDGLRAKCDDIARGGESATSSTTHHHQLSVSTLKVRLASCLSRLLTQYTSELILWIMYGIERYSLMKSSATAAEGVYGMKRSRVVMERDGADGAGDGGIRLAPLTQGDKVRCAIVAAMLPYLKEKLALLYQRHQHPNGTTASAPPSTTAGTIASQRGQALERMRHKVRAIFMSVYPYLSMTTEGASLAYQFMFLAGLTGYYSPSMHLLGVLARRITRADLQDGQMRQSREPIAAKSTADQNAPNVESGRQLFTNASRRNIEGASKSTHPANISTAVMTTLQSGKADNIVRAIRTAIVVGGSTLLVTGWISHFREELRQRRRRWISGEDSTTNENGNLQQQQLRQGSQNASSRGANRNIWTPQSNPIPPPHPPKLLNEAESEYIRRGLPQDNASCPICHRPRVNPAASTSGYVFCYRCLVMHLRSNGERCPLTGMYCPESRVIRLFEPTATGTTAADISADGGHGRDTFDGNKDQGAGQSTGFDK